jgi:uncharacterized membrane protein
MSNRTRRTIVLHRLFAAGMWLKGVDGVLEIAGGLLLLRLNSAALNRLVVVLTQHELVEDPHDRVANALRAAVAQLSNNTRLLGSLYLIAHGLIKIGVVVGVLRGYRRAYPLAIGFLFLFIVYQLYRLSYDYTAGLLILTIFDMIMAGLTWWEYRRTVDT